MIEAAYLQPFVAAFLQWKSDYGNHNRSPQLESSVESFFFKFSRVKKDQKVSNTPSQ